MESNLTLGEKIRFFRKRSGLSQFDLELKIATSSGSLSRIENDQVNPTKETILAIINALNLNVSDSSSLFNLDITKEFNNIIEISGSLKSTLNMSEISSKAVNILSKLIGIDMVTFWLWNEETKSLGLNKIKFPESMYNFVGNVSGFDLKQMQLREDIKDQWRNDYLRTLLEENVIRTTDVYWLAHPFINRTICNIIQKMAEYEVYPKHTVAISK